MEKEESGQKLGLDKEKGYPIGWQGAINRGSALLAKTYCTPGASRWDKRTLEQLVTRWVLDMGRYPGNTRISPHIGLDCVRDPVIKSSYLPKERSSTSLHQI